MLDHSLLMPNSEVIRVFPRRTQWTPDDDMAFVGPPPLFRPGTRKTPVRVSVTFTWDRYLAETYAASWRDHYDDVQIGGPAYDTPASGFLPGRFLKKGCVITSRGCPKKCGWCKVPFSEGDLQYLYINDGWIVQDNNLLACKREHTTKVFDMLRAQKRAIFFNGGLDKDFLKDWHVELFNSIKIGELWFACDTAEPGALKRLARARDLLHHVPDRKMRCYTMIGYDYETLDEAETRIRTVYGMGFWPFSQLYQPPTADKPTKIYPLEWKKLNKFWSRPAAYRSVHAQ